MKAFNLHWTSFLFYLLLRGVESFINTTLAKNIWINELFSYPSIYNEAIFDRFDFEVVFNPHPAFHPQPDGFKIATYGNLGNFLELITINTDDISLSNSGTHYFASKIAAGEGSSHIRGFAFLTRSDEVIMFLSMGANSIPLTANYGPASRKVSSHFYDIDINNVRRIMAVGTGCHFEDFQLKAFPSSFSDSIGYINENQVFSCDAGGMGDPHFRTWTGLNYDFQGACDLVLLMNAVLANGKAVDVHIRTVLEKWWSYISIVAIRIGDDIAKINVSGGVMELNGTPTTSYPMKIGGLVTVQRYERINSETNVLHFSFVIHLTQKDSICIHGMDGKSKEMGIVFKSPSEKIYRNSFGMMGAFPSGQMIARDRKTLISDPTAFGEHWRVQQDLDPLLFDGNEAKSVEKCSYPGDFQQSVINQKNIMNESKAMIACKDSVELKQFCVQDVMVTGDSDIAEEYSDRLVVASD